MEQSSSGSTKENKQINDAASGRNGDAGRIDSNDPANQRMVADRLLAALASGNLEHLAQARQAFIKQSPVEKKKDSARAASQTTAPVRMNVPHQSSAEEAADLAAALERRTATRTVEKAFVPVDELLKQEEELKKAEQELERRRAEVQAAKKKAEDDAKRRAFQEARRQVEAETRKKAEEEEQIIASATQPSRTAHSVPACRRNRPELSEAKVAGILEEEFTLFRKQQVEPCEIDLLLVRFDLREIRVQRCIQRNARAEAIFQINSPIDFLI